MHPISDWLSFIHTEPFDTDWEELGLGDEDLARLQTTLIDDPLAGDVVAGSGGVRKVRFARSGEGKSGSLRVGYAFIPDHGIVLLLVVYGKSSKTNLTVHEKRYLKTLLEQFKELLDAQ